MSEEKAKIVKPENQKYATIEEVAIVMGIEINDATKPFLNKFVKKAGVEGAGQRKKELLAKAEAYGLAVGEENGGFDPEKENVDSLKIRIIQHLLGEARFEELTEFASSYNLVVDTDTGRIFRQKAAVKKIEDRNAGQTPGSVGALSIAILQDERYADMTIAELVTIFPTFAEEQTGEPKTTTQPALQWYVNYCRKHDIAIIDRKRPTKAKVEGAGSVGAELTLDKALAAKGFAKKKIAEAGAASEASEGELTLD